VPGFSHGEAGAANRLPCPAHPVGCRQVPSISIRGARQACQGRVAGRGFLRAGPCCERAIAAGQCRRARGPPPVDANRSQRRAIRGRSSGGTRKFHPRLTIPLAHSKLFTLTIAAHAERLTPAAAHRRALARGGSNHRRALARGSSHHRRAPEQGGRPH
jgi:hypothetical protein